MGNNKTKDSIEFLEELFGIKFLEYQKVILRNAVENEDYVRWPRAHQIQFLAKFIQMFNEMGDGYEQY